MFDLDPSMTATLRLAAVSQPLWPALVPFVSLFGFSDLAFRNLHIDQWWCLACSRACLERSVAVAARPKSPWDPKLKRQPLRKSSFIVGSWPPHKTGWLIDPLLPIIPRSWATKWLQSHPSLPEVSESQNGVQPWNLSWRRWVLRTYASPSFA